MRYVYIIERATSVDYEGIQNVSIEVYSSMKKARARLPLCLKEDYEKCKEYEDDTEVERMPDRYNIYSYVYNYHAWLYKKEVK